MTASRLLLSTLVAVVVMSSVPRAEVSVNSAGIGRATVLVMGPQDGDPGSGPWPGFQVYRVGVDAALALNPNGDANGDGPPSIAIDPVTGYPQVTWAWFDGHDHEIAFSRWDGAHWTPRLVLTSNDVEDLDPSIAISPDGVRWITWWRAGAPKRVMSVAIPAPGIPDEEEEVSLAVIGGDRSSVAHFSAIPRVAYQIDGAGATQIVAARREFDWEREVIHETTYQGPAGDGNIDVAVHSVAGKFWVDWIEAPGQLAFRVQDPATGAWSDLQTEAYATNGDSETFARTMARERIQVRVLRQP